MSGIVQRALIDRKFDTERNLRLLAVYIQPSKPFFGQSSAKRETRAATGVTLPPYTSRFAFVPYSSLLCLAFCACISRSPPPPPCVSLSALAPRTSPLCLAFRACVSRFLLVSCVSRLPLVFRVSRLCLTLRACFSRFALVFRVSPLCLAPRDCVSRSPHRTPVMQARKSRRSIYLARLVYTPSRGPRRVCNRLGSIHASSPCTS